MTGAALWADMRACRLEPGRAAFWWLGQHGFAVKLGHALVLVDPYLSPAPRRLAPPLFEPAQAVGVRLVLGTHDHADHIDRPVWPALAAASPNALFVAPAPCAEGLRARFGWGADRLRGLADGAALEADGVRVEAIPAAHEKLERDPATGASPFLGYLLSGNGVRLYHAGDTCLYEGLQARLRAFRPHAVFLPINGRDAKRLRRGCIGNMTYQEAADLAGAVAPGLTVPAHFDMFEGNTEDPALFADYMAVKYPDLKTGVPRYGERVIVENGETA